MDDLSNALMERIDLKATGDSIPTLRYVALKGSFEIR